MKKILFVLMTLFLSLDAQSIKAGYDVNFGFVGEIGKAEITYSHSEDDYSIIVHAWTTGMASTLTQNREESYISQGKIINGLLRPDVFIKFRKTDRWTRSNVFMFDHNTKEVYTVESKEENVTSTRFDVNTMKNVKVCAPEFTSTREPYEFYTDNDLLSLFFNTQKILPTLKNGESKKFFAIGSKAVDSSINIEVPDALKRQAIQEIMCDTDGLLVTIILNQDIFQSEKGELNVIFDEDGFAKNVLLRDVIFFGDIRSNRLYQTLSSK